MHAKTVDAAARPRVFAALGSLYFIWGSTFLAIRVALEGGFPPFLLAAVRFLLAGAALFAVLRLRGAPGPSARGWAASFAVGVLLCGANGLVILAQQRVSSGMAAVGISSVPLWAALIAGFFGHWPAGRDWLGLAIGFAGVLLLNTSGDLHASPLGAALLLTSSISWAFGSMWSRRLPLPAGLMASAAQMIGGGVALLIAALARGERFTAVPPAGAIAALLYLVVFGSVVGYSAYGYLLGKVRPALATSYSYVNPVVAVALGALLAGERVGLASAAALALILSGVGVVMSRRNA